MTQSLATWGSSGARTQWAWLPGRYQVAAEFVGEAVTGKVNGDSGPGLIVYWSGAIRSGDVQITVPATPAK